MTLVASPCFNCGAPVYPFSILPPNQQIQRGSRNPHVCLAPDCYNNHRVQRRQPRPPLPGSAQHPLITCVHPMSRRHNGRPVVVEPSNIHASSSSTVATFLPQENMNLEVEDIFAYPNMPVINE